MQPDLEDLIKKGQVLDSSKKYEEAIKCYDKAIEKNPKNAQIYVYKGNSLKNMYKLKEAINCYNIAIDLDPNNSMAIKNKKHIAKDMISQ